MYDFINGDRWEEKDGILINQELDVSTKYSEIQADDMIKVEDESWWFKYRQKLLLLLLDEYFDKRTPFVDIGGGNGVMSVFAQRYNYFPVLLEPSYYCCKNAQSRGVKNIIEGTLDDKGFLNEKIPQFLLADVLEHIEDDLDFVKLIHKKMRTNGVGLVMVPACKCLWSSEDEYDGHFRRYSLKEIEKIFEKCGFDIIDSNYFFGFLFFPILFIRVGLEKVKILKKHVDRTQAEVEKTNQNQFVKLNLIEKTILDKLQAREMKKIMYKRIPFGSSCYVIVRKKDYYN